MCGRENEHAPTRCESYVHEKFKCTSMCMCAYVLKVTLMLVIMSYLLPFALFLDSVVTFQHKNCRYCSIISLLPALCE